MRQNLEIFVLAICLIGIVAQFGLWRHLNRRPGSDAHVNAVRATRIVSALCAAALLLTWIWAARRYDVALYVAYGLVLLNLSSFLMWFLFAATDTSMHVHLLVETFRNGPLARSSLRDLYNKKHIIASRVPRLLALGQLKLANGRLQLGGQAVLRGAWVAATARHILGLPLRPPREAEASHAGTSGTFERIASASQSLAKVQQLIPHLPVVSFAIWLWFYLPRVWSFGFYNGDWWDLVVPRPWDYVANTFWYRPISIPFVYWLPSLIGYRPWVWQLMLALCMLASAYLLFRIFSRLSALLLGVREQQGYVLNADLGAAAFLLFPWTFGWSAWPTILGMGDVGLLFFLTSLFFLFAPEPDRRSMWLSVLFFTLATLSYEAFYFAFVPLLIIVGAACFARRAFPKPYWIPILALPAVQLLAIIYNRLIPRFVSGIDLKPLKPIGWNLLDEMRVHIAYFSDNLLRAFPNSKELTGAALAMGLALAIAIGVMLLTGPLRRMGASILAALVAIIGGVVIALFVFNMASYGLSGAGIMSRTSLGVSIWLCMMIFLFLFTAQVLRPQRLWGTAAVIAVVVLIVGFVPGFNQQHRAWKESWENSVRVMKQMPVEEISKLPPEAVIVYIGPTDVGPLQSIDSLGLMGWLLYFHPEAAVPNRAIKANNLDMAYYSFYISKNGERFHSRTFVVKADYHRIEWDGKNLQYSLPGHWKTEMRARKVFEWDNYRSTFREMTPHQSFGEPR